MKKIFIIFSLLVLPAFSTAFADDVTQVITLKDGSQIKGSLAGIDNGVYTVKTPIIGDVHVSANDVVSITNSNQPPPPAATSVSAPSMDQQVVTQQQKLMSNPQDVADLQEMLQDPEIAQALQDPALVQAVTSHNYQAVQNNPGVQKLMENPKMRELLQKLMSQNGQNTGISQ